MQAPWWPAAAVAMMARLRSTWLLLHSSVVHVRVCVRVLCCSWCVGGELRSGDWPAPKAQPRPVDTPYHSRLHWRCIVEGGGGWCVLVEAARIM